MPRAAAHALVALALALSGGLAALSASAGSPRTATIAPQPVHRAAAVPSATPPVVHRPTGSPLGYPRLANMYWPVFVDSVVIQALSRWDVVVLNTVWSNAQLAQLRALNPEIKIYFYVIAYTVEMAPQASDTWKLGNLAYATANDLWWYDKDGGIGSDWPNTRMCNITALGPVGPQGSYKEFIVARIEELVATHPDLDGVFFDNFWEQLSWQQQFRQLDSDCNPTHNPGGCNGVADTNAELDALWNTALREIAIDVRQRFDLLQAERPRPLAILTNNATDYFESLNGAMIEYFPSGHSNVDYDNNYGYNWNEEMLCAPGGYLTTQFNPSPYKVQVTNAEWWGSLWAPAGGTSYERHKRFTLASALLGDGYYSLDGAHAIGHGSLWWEPEYDHDGRGKGWLGQALGPPARILQPSGAEIIANGSFSSGLSPWLGSVFGDATGSFTADTTEFHSAPASARLQLTSVGPNSTGHLKLWQDPVPVAHHQNYTLRFWAKADSPYQRLEMHLYSEDCPNLRCWGDRRFWIPTEWTAIEISFSSTGSAATGLNLFMRFTGNIWIDDVSLRQGDTTLYRREFENGIVLLNYTNGPQVVELGGTYWRPKVLFNNVFDGARVTSETVPASDARIVLRDSTIDIPDSTVVSDTPPGAGRRNVLEQNYPNPFNPATEIAFEVMADAAVDLAIYDVAGRRVRTLVRGRVAGGIRHRVLWDGRDEHGVRLASGVYLYRLQSPAYNSTRKLVLVR